MSLNFDFLDADKDGRLPPSVVGVLFICVFLLGNVTGWFAHINYALRGEASQIVEDMKVGDTNLKELHIDLDQLDVNIEATNKDKRFTNEACLDYSNSDFVDSLRNNSGDEEF